MGSRGVPVSVKRAVVEADVSTLNVSEFCRSHGISTWLFYDLRRRFALEGAAALAPRSRAPKRVANKTSVEVQDRIVSLRKELAEDGWDCGPATIRFHLEQRDGRSPSEATIWRVLRDRGFITPDPKKRPKHTSRRFSAERANECWQIDATKWQLPNGLWVEIINVIDDCTRLLIASTAVGTCTTANSWDALCHGAARWGWPERVLSDNGTAFRGQGNGGLIPSLMALGIRDTHSRPYHPQTCGKIERFHQTLKLHLRCQDAVTAIDDLQRQLDRFSDYYNHRRPHRAIGRRIPADVWAETPRSGPADRPLNAVTSTHHSPVGRDGRIRIGDKTRISLGALHAGQSAQVVLTGRVAHVFINGRLVRQLEIDPAKRNQPLYTQGGHPRKRA